MDATTTAKFSQDVLAALATVEDDGRFGEHKVFIAAAYDAYEVAQGNVPTEYGLAAFKKVIVEAQMNGQLQLCRLDIPRALSAEKFALNTDSYTQHVNAEFHLIIDPRFA